jgi:hypothetical protein
LATLTSTSVTKAPKGTHELAERTMLNADGQAVPAGHPDAVVLLGVAGKRISIDQAVAVGLIDDPATVYPKHVGGGYYELSSGEKVKGKADAALAEKALQAGPNKAMPAGDNK